MVLTTHSQKERERERERERAQNTHTHTLKTHTYIHSQLDVGLAVWAELYGGNCRVVAYDAYGCGKVCESV
jgi:hypothetical protein